MSSPCCIYPQPRPREAWSLDNESWAGLGATSYPHPWSCWSAFGAKLFSIWFRRPKIVQVHSPNSMTSRHSVRTSRNSEFAFNTLYIVTLVVNMSTKTPKATACQSVIPDMSVYKSHENRKERNGQLDRYRIDSSKGKKNEGNSKPSAHLEQLFEIVAEFHGFLRRIYQRTHCQVPNKSNADPVWT